MGIRNVAGPKHSYNNIITNYFGLTPLLTLTVSVVDPKLFIPDPDPALNFPSSGSNLYYISIFRKNTKTPLKFNQKEES